MIAAYEGLLSYSSKTGRHKERWFVLDSVSKTLVKCTTQSHRSCRDIGSTHGRKGLTIEEVCPLSERQIPPTSALTEPDHQGKSVYGFRILSEASKWVEFYTKSSDDEKAWIVAISKLLGGLALGVSERLARRELLADKYALVRELGRGASGVVSLYTWQGKPFAIKKFLPKKSTRVPNRRAILSASGKRPSVVADGNLHSEVPEDVRREIALLKKASSLPYVVKLHDVILDSEHNEYYLVMEYMGGGAIAEWDGERKCYVSSRKTKGVNLLEESLARTYITNLVVGIQSLHTNRLCHRDIKPENLIADENHELCKIADLGVAHYFKEVDGALVDEQDVGSIELSSVGNNTILDDAHGKSRGMLKTTKGTYQFLPPEALTGDEFCGFKADIWAIGVTMYALLFGYLPFFSNDVVELFDKIEKDALCFPANCCDEEAMDLLRRMLEKDPGLRISLDDVLQHPWMNRAGNNKAVKENIRALRRSPALKLDACDLDRAVSVLQKRFEAAGEAVRAHRLKDLQEPGDANPHTFPAAGSYSPQPIDMSSAIVPNVLAAHVPKIAAQMHFEWSQSKHLDGWQYGGVRDDAKKLHPCLVPMRELDEAARLRNIRAVEETIKGALVLGYRIEPTRGRASSRRGSVPFPTGETTLPWEALLLVDLLAENAHEVWAAEYAACGWSFGASFDPEARAHPSLRPYMELGEREKELSRAGVACVMKTCACLGFRVSCAVGGRRARGGSE